jgi:hypothetical protein
MSKPTVGHKLAFIVCFIIVLFLGSWLSLNIFMSGLSILLFGAKMMLVPVLIVAAVYITWHAGKFFK